MSELTQTVAKPELTPREREVIDLHAKGLTRKEIADVLSISPTTAFTHSRNIHRKLGSKSMAHAIAIFVGYVKTEVE